MTQIVCKLFASFFHCEPFVTQYYKKLLTNVYMVSSQWGEMARRHLYIVKLNQIQYLPLKMFAGLRAMFG